MKWGETHHFRFNPPCYGKCTFPACPIPLGALGIDIPAAKKSSNLIRWPVWQFLGSKMFQGYRGLRFSVFWIPKQKREKNTPKTVRFGREVYIWMSRELWDVALGFNLTDLHFLSLECAPQEVGPIQTRRGCLVLFLQKILVGLKALAKNMASESEMA